MQAVRDSEWEVSEISRTRTAQEQNITLEMPYYDIVRIKAEESEEVRGGGRDTGGGGEGGSRHACRREGVLAFPSGWSSCSPLFTVHCSPLPSAAVGLLSADS